MTNYCSYCGKGPFPTEGGLNKHIGQSKACQEKDQLAFISHTATLWKNWLDATINRPSSPSPPPEKNPSDLEHVLLAVEQTFSLDSIPNTEHTLADPPQRNRVPEEETQKTRYFEDYPAEWKAGAAWGKDQPLFVKIKREQEENGTSKWGPFKDQDEWKLAEWLSKNAGQKQTDKFLKLNIVSTYSLLWCHGLTEQ